MFTPRLGQASQLRFDTIRERAALTGRNQHGIFYVAPLVAPKQLASNRNNLHLSTVCVHSKMSTFLADNYFVLINLWIIICQS